MAQIMTKRGSADNIITYEFICDTTADLQAIDPQYMTMGSIATVISGEAGFEVYMANSQKQWVNLGSTIINNDNNNESNNSSNSDKVILGPYQGKVIDYANVETYQRNVIISNNIISGQLRISQFEVSHNNRGYLYLQVAPKNYYYNEDYDYSETLMDMTKDLYCIFLGDDENHYYNEEVYMLSDDVVELGIVSTDQTISVTKFTPSDWQTLSNIESDTTEFHEYIHYHIIEEYDITQLQLISYQNWDQAGE